MTGMSSSSLVIVIVIVAIILCIMFYFAHYGPKRMETNIKLGCCPEAKETTNPVDPPCTAPVIVPGCNLEDRISSSGVEYSTDMTQFVLSSEADIDWSTFEIVEVIWAVPSGENGSFDPEDIPENCIEYEWDGSDDRTWTPNLYGVESDGTLKVVYNFDDGLFTQELCDPCVICNHCNRYDGEMNMRWRVSDVNGCQSNITDFFLNPLTVG